MACCREADGSVQSFAHIDGGSGGDGDELIDLGFLPAPA
jgi:hypothetical protein